jgi:hypothetical protein
LSAALKYSLWQEVNQAMAYNTMRAVYLKWRALETRLEAAREDLNHQYLALLHKAEALQLDTRLGLLSSTSCLLNQPLDSQTFQLQQRLKQALVILGKGFFRRSPTSVQLDILKYADRLEEICRQCHHLSVRLRLVHKVFDSWHQHPDLSNPQSLRLALFNPEAVWTSLLLRQRCLLSQQIINVSLANSWQIKLTVCQRWLTLLQPSLPPEIFQVLQNSLSDLENQTSSQPGQEPFRSLTSQGQLDHLSYLANQQATEIISSQPTHRNF